ncbi:MAG: hypothetical protein FWE28_09445 [Oscillospiraceae bacterium]|nr:hypothetical protein [Oscillospiraceae bacterium]
MKDTNKKLYLILALSGSIVIWNLANVLSTRDIGFSNLLGLLAGLILAVWTLISICLIKKKNHTNCEETHTVLTAEGKKANDTNKFIRFIRIFLIFAWIIVGIQWSILLFNLFYGHETLGSILHLLSWLVVAVLGEIYYKKKKRC